MPGRTLYYNYTKMFLNVFLVIVLIYQKNLKFESEAFLPTYEVVKEFGKNSIDKESFHFVMLSVYQLLQKGCTYLKPDPGFQ